MGKIIAEFIATVAATWLSARYLPGIWAADDRSALIAGAVLAVVWLLLRPVARLLTKPLSCLTFGIIGIAVDTALVWACSTYLLQATFTVESLVWALALAVIVNAARAALGAFFAGED